MSELKTNHVGHSRHVCSCGAVLYQCRCIGDKAEIVDVEACPACQKLPVKLFVFTRRGADPTGKDPLAGPQTLHVNAKTEKGALAKMEKEKWNMKDWDLEEERDLPNKPYVPKHLSGLV
jgi:hypothetical protein